MSQHHVTFIRDSDRTRVIFVLSGSATESAARLEAFRLAPRGFRMAAYRWHRDGDLFRVPCDGDDYEG